MPQLRGFRLGSGDADDMSSAGDKASCNESKVWGTSVFSTNFDYLTDKHQDENDIRQVAAQNSFKKFLAESNLSPRMLEVLERLRQTHQGLTLEALLSYSEMQIRSVVQTYAPEVPSQEVDDLLYALTATRTEPSPDPLTQATGAAGSNMEQQ